MDVRQKFGRLFSFPEMTTSSLEINIDFTNIHETETKNTINNE